MRHVKGAAVDVAAGVGALPLGDMASPHGGVISAAATGIRKAGEALTSQATGDHQAEQAHGRKAFDAVEGAKSVSATDLGNAARGALEAAQNLTYLARFTEYRAEHGVEPDPATLETPRRSGDPMPAAHEAMTELGAQRGRISLVDWDGDSHQGQAGARHLQYRIDIARSNRVRLDINMHDDATGPPRLEVRRTDGAASRSACTAAPTRNWCTSWSAWWPRTSSTVAVRACRRSRSTCAAGGPHDGQRRYRPGGLPGDPLASGLAVGGVAATGSMIKGFGDYLHEVHLTDKGLEQAFAKLDVAEVHTGDLRTAFSRAAIEVEHFEARVAGELRQRLSELEQAGEQPGLTGEQVAELDRRIGETRQMLDSLPAPDAAALVPLHTELPGLTLPSTARSGWSTRSSMYSRWSMTAAVRAARWAGRARQGGHRVRHRHRRDRREPGGDPADQLGHRGDCRRRPAHAARGGAARDPEMAEERRRREESLPSGTIGAGGRVLGLGKDAAGVAGQSWAARSSTTRPSSWPPWPPA